MSQMTAAGLYIHIPFCSSKCNYCDFNSYAGKLHCADEYFNSMEKEIEMYYGKMSGNLINTIFIGGGTPSCVDEKYISSILSGCRANFNMADVCEVTIESNPGTLDMEKLTLYRHAGINRISIGLQAYQRNLLEYLGRKHSPQDFISAIEMSKRAGFSNINADVIFGVPEQTMKDWKETLMVLVNSDIPHISAYSLKIEEGTKFGDMLERGELFEVEDELDRDMYHYAIEYLKENGFNQYELSNFAKPGYECRHNLTYWKRIDYLGLGAGAHSLLKNTRFSNEYSIEEYIKCINHGKKPVNEQYTVDLQERMSEYMFLGLRMTQGVSNSEFRDMFKQDMFEKYSGSFEELLEKRLIEIEGDNVRLTGLGLDLANQVFVKFV